MLKTYPLTEEQTNQIEKNVEMYINRKEAKRKAKEKKLLFNSIRLRQKAKSWRQRHSFEHLSRLINRRRGINLLAFDVWKIAKKQKLKCPYTGKSLVGTTLSIDHIIPLSRGGNDDVNNLQILPLHTNLIKGIILENEFIQLCNEVAKFHPT